MNFDEYCGRFRFVADMNGDGAFSISDVALLAEAAFLLPATVFASALHSIPRLSTFFEISCATGQGWGGAAFSFVAWLVALVLALAAFDS